MARKVRAVKVSKKETRGKILEVEQWFMIADGLELHFDHFGNLEAKKIAEAIRADEFERARLHARLSLALTDLASD